MNADGARSLRPFSRGLVWAWTASEAASFDARSIEEVGVPQPVLMENAGRSAALVARALVPGRAAVALVGSGNNGGDALVALRSLAAWGCRTTAILTADRPSDDPLLHGWDLPVHDDTDLDDEELERQLSAADVVLDGILGTGVQGAPRTRQARVIEILNRSGTPVVALDIPSGADASTGATPGAVVDASLTVSFGAPKIGTLLHPARAHAGRHVCVEIGFPPLGQEHASALVVTPAWARSRQPKRSADTHKNRVGRVVVVGGNVGMAGAAILAGQAAFRAGAGLVQVVTAVENRDAVHAALPEAIFVDWGDEAALEAALTDADAVAVGPGLGTDDGAAGVLRRATGTGGAPLLLDADALNLAARDVVDLKGLGDERAVLLTPHPGEMARLLDDGDGRPPTEVARIAAERFGCTVLLKGAPSVVAGPDEPVTIDTQSSSDLAVAGMGDTLSGVCASFLAQGLTPSEAGALGLYVSGRAARVAGRGAGLVPSDVAERIPDILVEEGEPVTDLELPFVIFDADAAR